jgi:hypothetical protein
MRLLAAGTLAALTAAGLAAIQPAVLTDEEREAARAIQERRMRADVGFLSSSLLEGRGAGTKEGRFGRAYLASRLEAIGLEPGASGGSWEQAFDGVVTVLGRLPGRDPGLAAEVVAYTAPLDDAPALASILAIAEAFAALPERPRRSILFAAIASGERSLSEATDSPRHPPPPLARLVAHLGVGGACDRPDPLGFARAGVPSACLEAGTVEDAQLAFHVGAKVASAPLTPTGRPADALGTARLHARAEAGRE